METRQVLSVDAFADEPLGGTPFPVVPGEISDTQLGAVAAEFGAHGALTLTDGDLRYVQRDAVQTPIAAAVAGCLGLQELDELGAGSHTVRRVALDGVGISGSGESESDDGEGNSPETAVAETAGTFTVETTADRQASIDVPEATVTDIAAEVETVADTLGVEPAPIAAMDDLPVGVVGGFGGTLVVPLNFLEHVGRVAPDFESLADLVEDRSPSRVLALTFDTLAQSADVHGRVFDPAAAGGEVAASGVAAAACGTFLSAHEAFDGDREQIRIESGHFCDRAAVLTATLASAPRVTGRGLVSLEGRIGLPAAEDTDIVEV